MKSIQKMMALLLMGAWGTTAMASEGQDTLVMEHVNMVKIETRDTVQRIVISGYKDDPTFHYVQRISIPDTSAVRRKVINVHNFNLARKENVGNVGKWGSRLRLNVGLNAMVGVDDGYDFKVWPSYDLGLAVTREWRPWGTRNEFSFGLGVDWRYYRMGNNDLHWSKVNNEMVLTPYADGQTEKRSSLHVFSVQLPLLYTHYFDQKREWSVTVGGIVNWNAMGEAFRCYEEGGEKFDVTQDNIGVRPFTIDGIVAVDVPGLPALYCKYSPNTLFKSGRGPKMHQLSFGVCF